MITVIFSSKMIFLHQIEMTAVFKDHFVGITVILVEIRAILVSLIKSGRSKVKDDGLVGLSGRSKRLKSDGPRKCPVLKSKCGRLATNN